jgi:hypothetical protein
MTITCVLYDIYRLYLFMLYAYAYAYVYVYTMLCYAML